jgi:hypothetical protein
LVAGRYLGARGGDDKGKTPKIIIRRELDRPARVVVARDLLVGGTISNRNSPANGLPISRSSITASPYANCHSEPVCRHA